MDKIGEIKVCCSQCKTLPKNKVMIECIDCQRETNHNVVAQASRQNSYDNNGYPLWDHHEWEILECCGCGQVTFQKKYVFSEDDTDPEVGYVPSIELFPQRGKSRKDYYNVPPALETLYREVITCYNNESSILCAAGLRALVEGVCKDRGVKDGPVKTNIKGGDIKITRKKNIEGKIEGLFEKGFLTRKHADVLHAHRFLGNEALHELEKPSIKELKPAIEIIEHTFENIYELKAKHENFKREQLLRRKEKAQQNTRNKLFDL